MTRLAERLDAEIRRDLADLEQLRGDLKLQVHLLTMDAKSTWNALEKRWEGLRNDAKLQAGTTFRTIAKELEADYRKLKDELRGAA